MKTWMRCLAGAGGLLLPTIAVYMLCTHWRDHGWQAGENLSFVALAAASLLMPINWYFEVLKWRIIRGSSWKSALADVLAGQGLALISPNRIGDGIARVARAPKEERLAAGAGFVLGSAAQLLVTLVAGMIAIFFLPFTPVLEAYSGTWQPWLVFAVVAVLALYLFPGALVRLLPEGKLSLVLRSAASLRARLLALSALRYAIFATQFALLVCCMAPELPLSLVYAGVGLTYLISTLVPASVLGELGLRESAAVVAFGSIGNPAPALVAVAILWLLNLGIPSLAGALLLARRANAREAKA